MSSRVARSSLMSSSTPAPDPGGPPADGSVAWSVIVPVKQTTRGKSRLTGFTAEHRRELALAFALDTVAAALPVVGVRRVVVVTNDPDAAEFERLGASVIADAPDAGLNAAFLHGAHHVSHLDPTSGLVALAGDLPALTPDTLETALRAAPPGRWFVADSVGTGTTTLGASGTRLAPSFGPHSRAEHRASGAAELDMSGLTRLRRDVDTEVDLQDAIRLGVGVHTGEALSRHRLGRLA